MRPKNVLAPETFTSSNSERPSTSIFPFASILPAKVEPAETLTKSNVV